MNFEPSEQLDKPHAMIVANVFAADSDDEARRLFTSVEQAFVNLRRGAPGQLPAPLENGARPWSEFEQQNIDHALAVSFVGAPDTVRAGLQRLVEQTGAERTDADGDDSRSRGATAFVRVGGASLWLARSGGVGGGLNVCFAQRTHE